MLIRIKYSKNPDLIIEASTCAEDLQFLLLR